MESPQAIPQGERSREQAESARNAALTCFEYTPCHPGMVKKRVVPLVLLACSIALAFCDTTRPAFSMLMKQVPSSNGSINLQNVSLATTTSGTVP